MQQQVSSCLDEYNQQIHKVAEDDYQSKLKVIVRVCHNLERLHPFLDSNCRVIGMLLLNRLLLENGFTPCIMDNPNQLDGYSIDQCVDAIQKGMLNVATILNRSGKPLSWSPVGDNLESTHEGARLFVRRMSQSSQDNGDQKCSAESEEANVNDDSTPRHGM